MFSDLFLVCVSQCGFPGLALQQAGGGGKSLLFLPLPAFRAEFGKDRGVRHEGKTLTHSQPLPSEPLLPPLKFWALLFIPFYSELAGIEFSCCQGGEVVCLTQK